MNLFSRMAQRVSYATGRPGAFLAAVTIILVWVASGPVFHFDNTWQLVINTGTTIVTFLVVFLIQNSQTRDTLALHIKLDELLRAVSKADNRLIKVEDDTEGELQQLHEKFRELAERSD